MPHGALMAATTGIHPHAGVTIAALPSFLSLPRVPLHPTLLPPSILTPPPPTRSVFLAASRPDRQPRQDLCNLPPFACNEKGELVRFIAPSADLTCKGLPAAFANLTALQSLDLSGNKLADTTANVASIVSRMPDLRRMYLRNTGLEGGLGCEIIGPKLQVRRRGGVRATLRAAQPPPCCMQPAAWRACCCKHVSVASCMAIAALLW
jgi:hypothetical protein